MQTTRYKQHASINFRTKAISDIIQKECLCADISQRKLLVLYCHNETDRFGEEVYKDWLNDYTIKNLLSKPNLIVFGYNITSVNHRNRLVEELRELVYEEVLSSIISGKSKIYIFIPYGERIMCQSSIDKGNDRKEFLGDLSNVIKLHEGFVDKLSENQLRSIKNRANSFGKYYQTTYRHANINFDLNSIDEIIKLQCLGVNLSERKILVLYCHNENDSFGKTVCMNWFADYAIQNLLSRPNLVLFGYNITRDRNSLIDELTETIDDDEVFSSIRSGKSKIYIFIPYGERIMCQSFIDSSDHLQKFQEELWRIIKLHADNNKPETCAKFQQVMFGNLGNQDYNIFTKDDHPYLWGNIGFAYFGAPKKNGYETKQTKVIDKAFEAILDQSDKNASSDGVVYMSIVYACCAKITEENNTVNMKLDEFKHEPIFVLRKCHPHDDRFHQYNKYCRIIIDSTLRVYTSWEKFLNQNKYPPCVLCTPKNGKYSCDDNGHVLLDYHYSPTCSDRYKLLNGLDIATSVVGFGTLAISVIALPIVGLVGGAYAGAYYCGRAIVSIVDRSQHDEDLSFSNAESRAAYLNIAAGVMGFAAIGANVYATNMANAGKFMIKANTILSTANLLTGGATVTNSLYQIYHNYSVYGELPSEQTLIQLGASALFFSYSLYSHYKTVSFNAARANRSTSFKPTIKECFPIYMDIAKILLRTCESPDIKTIASEILGLLIPSVQSQILTFINRVSGHKDFTTGKASVPLAGIISDEVVEFIYRKAMTFFNLNAGSYDALCLKTAQIMVQYYICRRPLTELLVIECINYVLHKSIPFSVELCKAEEAKKAIKTRERMNATRRLSKCNVCYGNYYCRD